MPLARDHGSQAYSLPRTGFGLIPIANIWRRIQRAGTIALHPAPEDAWLAEAQLDLYIKASKHSPIMLPIGAALIAAASSEVPLSHRLAWFGIVIFLTVFNQSLYRWVEARADRSLANLRLRLKVYTGCALLFIAAWCSMSVFLWVPDQPLNHMMLILILACSLAGAIAMTAVHTGISFSIFVSHISFMLLPVVIYGSQNDYIMGGLTLVYGALLIGQAVALHASSVKMLTLERERAGLVRSLSLAKEQSDRDRAHAAAAGRAKSQFLSNMNHELRTPMNAILGFSELIETKAFGTDIDKYAEYAGIIHGSGQHLLTLINDMLDLAKIEGGRLSLREDEMNIVCLLGDVAEANETNAAERQINLVRELDAALPPLFADERAMRQIAVNLISNALKFTQPGGTITMFARTDNRGRILFGVRDTGIGIAPEDHDQVFERFGRSRHDITIADQGTGLGLAIVKGFAEAHDGHVRLESALGKGTTLTVVLPAERARPAGYTTTKAAS